MSRLKFQRVFFALHEEAYKMIDEFGSGAIFVAVAVALMIFLGNIGVLGERPLLHAFINLHFFGTTTLGFFEFLFVVGVVAKLAALAARFFLFLPVVFESFSKLSSTKATEEAKEQ